MSTVDVAVAALGVNSALTTGALVYTVRRVSPWPKPPVQPQPRALPAGNGSVPPAGAQ